MKTRMVVLIVAALCYFSNAFLVAAPAAPSNAVVVQLPEQLHLTWQDNSNDEYGFTVQCRRGQFEIWEDVASIAPNRTSYQMDNPLVGFTYYFRIRAFNDYGWSDWSNTASRTVAMMLHSLKVKTPDGGQALPAGSVYPIAWGNYYNPPAQVNLDYSVDGGTNWIAIKANYPNSGSGGVYYWKIPEQTTTEGRIRVRSSTSGTNYDLSNHVFSILGYDFDRAANQGWTVSAIEDEDGYPINADFRFSWSDTVEYPQQPGMDPAGNGQGSVAIVKNTAGIIYSNLDNILAKYWNQKVISPDLTNLEYWQHALGFSVKIAHCMQTGAKLYSNLIVELYDHDTQTIRWFTYPANASELTYTKYGVGYTWNHRWFLWSNIPNFPVNFTLKRIYVSIWGDLGWNYQNENNGSVFIDHIMPVWPSWDFNADGITDMADFAAFSTAWQTNSSHILWNPVFDRTPGNDQIDMWDLRALLDNWLMSR